MKNVLKQFQEKQGAKQSAGAKRRLSYGVNNSIVVVGFLVVVILLNVVIGAVSSRFPVTVDLTKQKIFSIGDATREVLSNLDEDITVYYLLNGGEELQAVSEVLDHYTRASNHIKVEKVNYAKNPGFLQKYAAENLSAYSLIVEGKNDAVAIDYYDMYSYQYGEDGTPAYAREFLMESKLTNAILLVTSDTHTVICYTEGHGETDMTALSDIIRQENMTTKTVNLITGDIPEDCSLLWIDCPESDFSEAELQKLDAFTDRGGNIQVILDINSHPPILCRYLSEWGMIVNDDVVAENDASRTVQGNPFQYLVSVGEHEISSLVQNRAVLAYNAGSITANPVDRVSLTPIVATTEQASSFAVADASSGNFDHPQNKGRAFLGMLSEDVETGGEVCLFTSAYLFHPDLVNGNVYGNHEFLLGLLRYLAKANITGISVEGKSLETKRLILSDKEIKNWAFVCIPLLPLIVIVIGAAVLLKRQRQ